MTERIFPPKAKTIWLREELHCADDLLSYVPDLLKDFLAYHNDWMKGNYEKSIPYESPYHDTSLVQNRKHSWNVEVFKYVLEEHNVEVLEYQNDEMKKRFPTACALVEKYEKHCKMAIYSSFEPDTEVKRHTDLEHVSGKRVRIHIPLYIPPGDVFQEFEGIEIDWSDICGVAGNYLHSAYNYSNQRRLIFIIDLTKEFLNIPEDSLPDEERCYNYPDFIRGEFPKLLHTCQK